MRKKLSLVIVTLLVVNLFSITAVYAENAKNQVNEIQVWESYFGEGEKYALKKMDSLYFTDSGAWGKGNVINILSHELDQKMIGIGGALTESAVSVINSLPADKQQEIYDAYYDESGANYSIVRTHIGSCDFSTSEYTYAPTETSDLSNFSIDPDKDDIIPAIKRALTYNAYLKVFAAPWAPPGWMKHSGIRYGNGDGSGINAGSVSSIPNHILPKYYPLYAKYFVEYLKAYKEEGIDFYSISVQNEAQNNPNWEACTWSINTTIDFISNHLGPRLNEEGFEDVKLLVWDWDKQEGAVGKGDGFISFNKALLQSSASKYIDGIGFHWYGPLDLADEIVKRPTWAVDDFKNIAYFHKNYPNTLLVATEGCQEKGPWLNSLDPAKRYVFDMINDFKFGTTGWIDWNIVLNTSGGPLHRETNYCHAPMMVDTTNNNIIYNPAYYVFKHMSRTIRPNEVRVETESTSRTYRKGDVTTVFDDKDYEFTKGLHEVAFLDNETGRIKLVVGNISNKVQECVIREGGRYVTTSIKPYTLVTFSIAPTLDIDYNAASNKSATASSYESNPFHDYSPSQAIDGDTDTRWASDWEDEESITIDLGEEKSVVGVDLLWENGWTNEYEILVSSNNTNWTTAKHVNGSNMDIIEIDDMYPTTINFAPVTGRYVMLKGVNRNQSYGYSLYEMQIVIRD
ncbi:MAG: discoidin domain-containing protein [Vallitalea sp.]|jgi:glucosylceramidase|nr:discoidin domain-containing protein [Vallitalea sp.]